MIAAAFGELTLKTSSAAVPVALTLNSVPVLTSSFLLARFETVVLAVTPSRVKVAVPALVSAMVIAPVAEPRKLTPLAASTTLKLGSVMRSIFAVRLFTSA